MATSKVLQSAFILAAASAVAVPAMAGGLERGGYNIDLLFDDSDYAIDSSATFVAPQRKVKNADATIGVIGSGGPIGAVGAKGSSDANDAENFWSKRIGARARFGDNLDCMFDYSEPWGAHLKPGQDWKGAIYNIETDVYSRNYATTCRVKFDLVKGSLSVIGGGFFQELGGFKDRLAAYTGALDGNGDPVVVGNIVGRLQMKGNGWGWRTGLAYEIPEIALRASLVYNSAVDHDLSGTVQSAAFASLPGGATQNIVGQISMPDSAELKVQSGIAENWLAFGSVKWTDWSQLQAIPFCNPGAACVAGNMFGPTNPTGKVLGQLNLFYRDGWTISGGVGHKINDQWSVGGSLTWDRGVSNGMGALTDTWTVGTAVTYKPVENIEVRLAGAVGILTSGTSVPTKPCGGLTCGEGASYDFGTDMVYGLSTGVKIRF